jgi:hypothetical protein
MRIRGSAVLVAIVVAACAGAGLWLRRDRALGAASSDQVRLLEPEIEECQQRLRAFHGTSAIPSC